MAEQDENAFRTPLMGRKGVRLDSEHQMAMPTVSEDITSTTRNAKTTMIINRVIRMKLKGQYKWL